MEITLIKTYCHAILSADNSIKNFAVQQDFLPLHLAKLQNKMFSIGFRIQ